jgi:hypothetical protein
MDKSTTPPRDATRGIETTQGILTYSQLAPGTADEKAYLAALRAADRLDWLPLMDTWRKRFERFQFS